MPAAQLYSQGAIASVARQLELGRSPPQVLDWLRRSFPGEATSTYRAVLGAGARALDAGIEFNTVGPGERLPASAVPGYTSGVVGYRFTVDLHITNPNTGETRYSTESLYFSANPTRQEVTDRANQLVAGYALPSAPGARDTPPPAPWQLVGFSVVAVERA